MSSEQQSESSDPRESIDLGYWLVAFIDVLGQQAELERLAAVSPGTERAEIAEIIRRTAGRVERVRRGFGDVFRVSSQHRLPPAQFTPEQEREYLALRELKFKTIGFADSFVVAVPLDEGEYGPAQAAIGVWSTLNAIAATWLESIAREVPLRAGIDVHLGIDMFPDEVYGPAAVCAYRLESIVAHYPRAVVGDGLLDYLTHLENRDRKTRGDAMGAAMADDCRKLICAAPDDGHAMLHPLSPDILAMGEMMTDFAQRGAAWTHKELLRFQGEGNAKLAGYYSRLEKYFATYGYGPA